MAKYLKRFNKTTGEWEIISSPDVNINATLEDGSTIKDTNIVVTNYNYVDDDETGKTLDDTLTDISDDISKLQRNVSWLAEHGGNGGSGDGGSSLGGYGIVIENPILEGSSAYVNGDKVQVAFRITGGTDGDICKYSYTYDGTTPKGYQELSVNTTVTITLDNTNSTLTRHYLTIYAKNPYNNTISPKSFYIYKSTFTIVNNTDSSVLNDSIKYTQGIYNVSYNYITSGKAYMPFLVQCGLMGAEITLTSSRDGEEPVTFKWENKTTEQYKKNDILLKDMIDGIPVPGTTYVLTFEAQAVYGTLNPIKIDKFKVSVRVVNPNDLTIVLAVDGVAASDDYIDVAEGSDFAYTYTFLGPTNISTIVYAVKLQKEGEDAKLIYGNYYDETLKNDDATDYKSNEDFRSNINGGGGQSYTLSNNYLKNDKLTLTVKAWSWDGKYVSESSAKLLVGDPLTNIFPRQYPDGTLLMSFNNSYNITNTQKWESEQSDYDFMDASYTEDDVPYFVMNVLNSNGENSGIFIDDTTKLMSLRLQNKAYATVDVSAFSDEINRISGAVQRPDNNGFVVSFTYSYDKSSSTDHTVFLWGVNNNTSNSIANGFRIDCNKATWAYTTKDGTTGSISCNVPSDVKTTVDFVYDRSIEMIIIYINGIPNAAQDLSSLEGLSPTWTLPYTIYIGCNLFQEKIANHSDMNVYDFSVYTVHLNDLSLNINSKNARLNGRSSNEDVIADYNTWKKKNFIYTTTDDLSTPLSYFVNSLGEMQQTFDMAEMGYIANNSNIPTLALQILDDKFTESFFYAPQASNPNAKEKHPAQATYYPVNGEGSVCTFSAQVALQGTSTMNYKVKNIELYTDGEYTDEETSEVKKYLFQPKSTWMPEKEFTLKADVVDSAHANNSCIGEWINNSGLFENTPPMDVFEANRPKDILRDGSVYTTYSEDGETTTDYHKDVTLKHTLEGFPILLFISFYGTGKYTLMGIYSFNLGRNSYYNMGMKFLKSFCRRDDYGNMMSCPAIITRYEEMDTLGGLKVGDVYNYEFSRNDTSAEHPLWSQYDPTMLRYWGEMKYPEDGVDASSTIWEKLSRLFQAVAQCPTGTYYDGTNFYTGFTNSDKATSPIYPYTWSGDGNDVPVKAKSVTIAQQASLYKTVGEHLSINNANAYFVICNAFGMTDSLGKNMELKTWDGGETWYPSFYDMDTALGLRNTGAEDIPVDCFIDKYSTVSDEDNMSTNIDVVYHNSTDYAAYAAKLWGLLRDRDYIYATTDSKTLYPYEEIWANLRKNGGLLSNTNTFAEDVSDKITTCGELVYCLDYYSKYINKGSDPKLDSSLIFLHGNRVEYIKDWIKKHSYFLDGVFDANTRTNGNTFTDSDAPFYNDSMTWAFWYQYGSVIPITLRVSTPTFITFNTNSAEMASKYYISEANKDFTIYYPNTTANNAQTIMYGTSLITKFNAFRNSGFAAITAANNGFCNLEELDLSNNAGLANSVALLDTGLNKAFNPEGKSPMETLNLSNATCADQTKTIDFGLSLKNFTKLLNIDISHSDVTSLALPSSTLETLNVSYSKITNLTVQNQPLLTTINVDGCDTLNTVSIGNCESIKTLTFSGLAELTSISVMTCDALETLLIRGNEYLTGVYIENCSNLKEIIIDNCTNANLAISITRCSSIETLKITKIESSKIIILPAKSLLGSVKALSFEADANLTALEYDGSDVETLDDGSNVFDISPFTNLEECKLKYLSKLQYLRVANNKETPFAVNDDTFVGCNSLTRIFGHISITGHSAFSGKKNFYLNDIADDGSGVTPFEEPLWSDSTGATNVSIKTNNLSSCFSRTKCNLSDVYYILQKCDNSYAFTEEGDTVVTALTSTFDNCSGITTSDDNSLNKDLFIHCGSVVNIDNLFAECGIRGYLSNRFLSDLPLLENFDSVFDSPSVKRDGTYKLNRDEYFFPEGCKIKKIVKFNPTSDGTYSDGLLFRNLASLESIEDSFNGISIRFMGSGSLFSSNPLLTVIKDSFLNMSCSFSSSITNAEAITDVFGATALVSVKNSFTFENKYGSPYIFMGNSFFDKIKGTLEEWDNVFNETYANGETISPKHINPNDLNEGENFPYGILSGCTNLRSAIGMFRGLNPINKDDVVAITPRILSGCTSLTDFSYGFAEMNFKYTLSSNIFENCHLTTLSHVFSDKSGYGKTGRIPYHLFYQKAGNIITDLSNAMSNSGALMITGSTLCGCYPYSATTEEMEQYGVEDGAWNPYIYDGSAGFLDRFTATEVYKTNKETLGDLPELFRNKDAQSFTAVQNVGGTEESDSIFYFEADATEDSNNKTEAQTFYRTIINGEYFCPADIFKYCTSSAKVEGCFEKAGQYDMRDKKFYGMLGSVPELLLQPITEAYSLNSLFNSFSTLTPAEFPYIKDENVVYGTMMPDGLFDNLTKVTTVNSMFAGIYSCGKCEWKETMFDSFATTLISASYLFGESKWKTTELLLNANFFAKCKNLEDISYMFYKAEIYSSPIWFINSILKSCVTKGFMREATVYGTVPDFWNYSKFNGANHEACFYNINYSGSIDSIPDSWRREV